MQQEDFVDAALDCRFIALLQRCSSPASDASAPEILASPVLSLRPKGLPRRASRRKPGVVVDQETPVGHGLVADGADIRVVETQADIIVAAGVIQPGGPVELVGQAADAWLSSLALWVARASHNSAMKVAL